MLPQCVILDSMTALWKQRGMTSHTRVSLSMAAGFPFHQKGSVTTSVIGLMMEQQCNLCYLMMVAKKNKKNTHTVFPLTCINCRVFLVQKYKLHGINGLKNLIQQTMRPSA